MKHLKLIRERLEAIRKRVESLRYDTLTPSTIANVGECLRAIDDLNLLLAASALFKEDADRFLTIDDVGKMLSASTALVRRLANEGKFPAGVMLDNSRRAVRWRLREITDWMDSLPRAEPKKVDE